MMITLHQPRFVVMMYGVVCYLYKLSIIVIYFKDQHVLIFNKLVGAATQPFIQTKSYIKNNKQLRVDAVALSSSNCF